MLRSLPLLRGQLTRCTALTSKLGSDGLGLHTVQQGGQVHIACVAFKNFLPLHTVGLLEVRSPPPPPKKVLHSQHVTCARQLLKAALAGTGTSCPHLGLIKGLKLLLQAGGCP